MENFTVDRTSGQLPVDSEDVAIPVTMLALNVFSNGLAIVNLLHLKFCGASTSSPVKDMTQASHECSQEIHDVIALTEFRERLNTSECTNSRQKRPSVKFGPFHTLVSVLAVIDLLGAVCTTPVTLLLYFKNRRIMVCGGLPLCKYSAFMMLFVGLTTMAMVMIMSIERFLSIRLSYFYHRQASATKALAAAAIAFVAAAVVCSFPVLGFGAVRQMYPYTWCFADWNASSGKDKAFNYLYALLGLAMLMITLICNAMVIAGLIKMRRLATKRTFRRRKMSHETQMIIQLSAITLIFVVCWLPLMLRILANQMKFMISVESDRVAVWLVAANPILDPWVYILFRKSVCRRVFQLLKIWPCFTCLKYEHENVCC